MDEGKNSLEHIFPACIGGILVSDILCKKCNNSLGSSLISQILDDPTFHVAVENLKGEIPSIYEQFEKHKILIGEGDNSINVKIGTKGKSQGLIIPSKNDDGSINFDTKEAWKKIKQEMMENGWDESKIQKEKDAFLIMESGQVYRTPTNIYKRQMIKEVKREIPLSIIDDRLPALIAYEFLSLCVNEAIFHPALGPFREYLTGKECPEWLSIKKVGCGNEYNTYHYLWLKPTNPLQIHVRFFSWIGFVIEFWNINYGGSEYIIEMQVNKKTRLYRKDNGEFMHSEEF